MSMTQTQMKILEVGKKEFLKYGFKDASLQKIVSEAGFTKGAFYGYYTDKASLFEALVSDTADNLVKMLREAQDTFFDLVPENKTSITKELSTQYLRQFVNYIYDNFDEFKLIVCCAQGTKYSNFIHELVELDVERSEKYFELLIERGKIKGQVSHELHHMIISAYFTGVFETVVHDMTRDKAMKYIEELARFFNSGWDGILEFI